MKDDDTLFDPATRDRVRHDLARGTIAVFVVVTLMFGIVAGVLHRERPFLARMTGQCGPDQYAYECDTVAYDALAGFLGFGVFGLLAAVVYRYRRIPATVRGRERPARAHYSEGHARDHAESRSGDSAPPRTPRLSVRSTFTRTGSSPCTAKRSSPR